MSGVQQVKLNVLQVLLVWVGPIGWKNMIVFSPYDQGGRLIFAKIGLPGGVAGDIVLVIEKQGKLNGGIAFLSQVAQVHIPVVGTDGLPVSHPMGILPFDPIWRDEAGQWFGIFGSTVFPVFADGIPKFVQTRKAGLENLISYY